MQIVRRGHAHAGQRLAVIVERRAAHQSLVHELPVSLIDVEDRRRLVARHIDVGQPVAVEIAGEHAERVIAIGLRDAAFIGDVAKDAALVVIENIAIERQSARAAIHGDAAIEAIRIGARLRRGVEIEFQIIGDEEIELAVVVVIDEGAAGVVANAILGEMHFAR